MIECMGKMGLYEELIFYMNWDIEIRNKFDIAEKDPIEIYVDGSSIVLKKYEPNCVFCGNNKNLIKLNISIPSTK